MAWEKRKTHTYYYESCWIQGRDVKRYLGNGGRAQAAAQAVIDRARRRAENRREFVRVESELQEAETRSADAHALTKLLMQARLLADGFYCASYTWRKRKS